MIWDNLFLITLSYGVLMNLLFSSFVGYWYLGLLAYIPCVCWLIINLGIEVEE